VAMTEICPMDGKGLNILGRSIGRILTDQMHSNHSPMQSRGTRLRVPILVCGWSPRPMGVVLCVREFFLTLRPGPFLDEILLMIHGSS